MSSLPKRGVALPRLPLFVEVEGRPILVVGGGRVGTRRAKKFADAGARVTVIAERISDELKNDPRIITIERKINDINELEKFIKGSFMVVIATSSKEFNDKVYRLSKELGILVNDATNAARSDVHVPFEDEIDGIRVAVSSEGLAGVSAHLAIFIIRECLRKNMFWRNINKFVREFKKELKRMISDPKRRFQLYWFVMLHDDVMESIKLGRIDEALKVALDIAKNAEHLVGYEPEKAMPRFLDRWGFELLSSCCEPFEDQSTRG